MLKFAAQSLLGLIMLCLATPVWAQNQRVVPTGPVLVEVSGLVTQANVDGEAHFDIEMLDRLPQHRIRTSTLWTSGVKDFTGPLLIDLLQQAGVTEGTLTLIALNDYRISIPFADLKNYPVIIATRQDGVRLTVRSRGPLWVMYPWDDFPELNSETYISRSIWQLRKIVVE